MLNALDTGQVRLNSGAGNIKMRVDRLGGDTHLETGAGSVNLEANKASGNLYASSSVGSVKLLLPPGAFGKIKTKPEMGKAKVNYTTNEQSPYALEAVSSMGSVKIDMI